MKYLSSISAVLLLSAGLLGCSDDASSSDTSTGGGANKPTGSAGKSSTGGGPAVSEKVDIVETALAAGKFSQLAAALTAADLVDALKGKGPFTVFAPDDDAFDAFEKANPGVLAGLSKDELTEILTYHVVSGAAAMAGDLKDDQVFVTLSGSPVLVDTTGGVKVSNATVTSADVEASNGVIHVIDTIMLPPKDDVVATAIAAKTFTALADALTSAELVETLQGPGPFTVFAPTDDAFAKLKAVPTGDALKDVLLYHVVSGAVGSGDLKAGKVPTLLDGKSITVSLGKDVKVDAATVTAANIIAKNGVIHVIDSVIVPK